MNIEFINKYIYNNDIDGLTQYFKSLSIEDKNIFINYLIEQLSKYRMPVENNQRNTVALTLSELNCDESIPCIIKIIKNEYESKYIGTLVYSLQNLNCADYINQIFFLLYSGNYEVRRNMFELIEQKKDKISSEDFENMKNNLNKIIENYKDILIGLYIAKDEIFSD